MFCGLNMRFQRKVLVFILVTICIPLLLMKGCQSLTRTIYWSMDCDQFNIDHIEVRTGINIPKVSTLHCSLSSTQRLVDFNVHLDDDELHSYADKHFTYQDSLHSAEGVREHHRWFATLDTANRILHFELQYLEP